MCRRALALLLLPCLPLTQSAGLGHHHGTDEPAGHDSCPHFHAYLHPTPAGQPHPQRDHDSDGDSRHRDGDEEPEPFSDHDDDAVYVAVDAVASGRVHADDGSCGPLGLAPPAGVTTDPREGVRGQPAFWAHPPPAALDRPLYLRHLSLLI